MDYAIGLCVFDSSPFGFLHGFVFIEKKGSVRICSMSSARLTMRVYIDGVPFGLVHMRGMALAFALAS
jgi:hypothetical protein